MEKAKEKLYLKLLTDIFKGVKLDILKSINNGYTAILDISKDVKQSPPLVFYHIHGNHKTDLGLFFLGLVDKIFINDKLTKYEFKITDLGKQVLIDVA